jgi:hypothetical protein
MSESTQDWLAFLNQGTTSTIQIFRTLSGQDPAAMQGGKVTSSTDSTGFLVLGLAIILLFVWLLSRK